MLFQAVPGFMTSSSIIGCLLLIRYSEIVTNRQHRMERVQESTIYPKGAT